jgi:cation diffusion facilitator family transporter
MFKPILIWMGFAPDPGYALSGGHSHHHGHSHGDGEGHGHTHGVIDPTIATTTEGIWAIKWSFVILMATTIAQIIIVYLSGSVALLADTIHNFGDAATAIPLWIAFLFARRAASKTFNYGLGRVEDLAGVVIVGLILFSAIVAGYTSIDRLINPREIDFLGVVALAGVIGFLGNEAVAVFRIRVGRRINSAALVADGYHARVDGFGSLAVVAGALGVWLGFPLADPIVGLIITALIFGIVWQSATAVFRRMLDGVEPEVLDVIRETADHVPGIISVPDVKARWLGHKLRADITMAVDPDLPISMIDEIALNYENELKDHLPALSAVHIRARPVGAA